MKKLLILAFMAFSLSSFAQNSVTVTSNGSPVPGLAVMYYVGSSTFYSNGLQNPPTFDEYRNYTYTDANGVLSQSWTQGDTLYFATRDCNGNFVWVAAPNPGSGGGLNTSLSISCIPSDCDAYFKQDTAYTMPNTFMVHAINMREFSYTSLPTNVPSKLEYFNSTGSGVAFGNISASQEGFLIPASFYSAGQIGFCYSRVDSACTSVCDTLLISSFYTRPQVTCNPSYDVDTLNSGLAQNQIVLLENSTSNGNIISYDWDFGDGTIINNNQYPSHTYSSMGTYPICLTITARDPLGPSSCVSTYCDTIGFDANGNLVYKGMTGFTINVIDPATVGLEDKVLESSLSLYPNPAADKAKLSWDASLNVQNVAVYSISGQKLVDFQPSSNTAEISGLESGAYLVRVSSKTASKTLRLIIE